MIKSPNSVLVDTSYLISLFSKGRENNETSLKYQEYFKNKSYFIFLSTIVIAEFHQKQNIKDILELGDFKILPYNFKDAEMTAELIKEQKDVRKKSENRAEFKDDFKIIGQAKNNKIDFIITEDKRTLAKYVSNFNERSLLMTKVIILSEGFSEYHFNNGQMSLSNN